MAENYEVKDLEVVGKYEIINFSVLKEALTKRAVIARELVVTADKSSIDFAKKERAFFNGFATAVNNKKIGKEKDLIQSLEGLKQLRELVDIAKESSNALGVRIKEVETLEDEKKKEEITSMFVNFSNPYNVRLEKIWNPKWLNKTVSLKSIEKEIIERLIGVENDMILLAELVSKENANEKKLVIAKYLETLNKDLAISEHLERKKIASQNEVINRVRIDEEVKMYDICFCVRASLNDITNLQKFLNENKITFKQVKNGVIKDSKIMEENTNENL